MKNENAIDKMCSGIFNAWWKVILYFFFFPIIIVVMGTIALVSWIFKYHKFD